MHLELKKYSTAPQVSEDTSEFRYIVDLFFIHGTESGESLSVKNSKNILKSIPLTVYFIFK